MSKTVLIIKNLSNNLKKYKCLAKSQRVKVCTFSITIIIAFSLLFCSCNLIFHHNQRKFQINSEPKGAKVYINDSLKGFTPLEVTYDFVKLEEKSLSIILIDTIGQDTIKDKQKLKFNTGTFLADAITIFPVLVSGVFKHPYKYYDDMYFVMRRDTLSESYYFNDLQRNYIRATVTPLLFYYNFGISYERLLLPICMYKESSWELMAKVGANFNSQNFFNVNYQITGVGANLGIRYSSYNERSNQLKSYGIYSGYSYSRSLDLLSLYHSNFRHSNQPNIFINYSRINLVSGYSYSFSIGYNFGVPYLAFDFGIGF